ncbi:MAG TPA: hypothetical protein VFP23_05140 [Solirubrobacterales bacterium]|nr:hypothetical protein [Solirubrobacterales bacterium]
MLDLDAYLERIGLDGRPSIAQVHRAQLTSIPFENLDPHQGLPVSLDVEDRSRFRSLTSRPPTGGPPLIRVRCSSAA